MPQILQRLDGGCGIGHDGFPVEKLQQGKLRRNEKRFNLAESVLHQGLFEGFGQEAVFRAVVVVCLTIVRVVMSVAFFPKMLDGHRHLVVVMVRNDGVCQYQHIGHQQHQYGKRSLHSECDFRVQR